MFFPICCGGFPLVGCFVFVWTRICRIRRIFRIVWTRICRIRRIFRMGVWFIKVPFRGYTLLFVKCFLKLASYPVNPCNLVNLGSDRNNVHMKALWTCKHLLGVAPLGLDNCLVSVFYRPFAPLGLKIVRTRICRIRRIFRIREVGSPTFHSKLKFILWMGVWYFIAPSCVSCLSWFRERDGTRSVPTTLHFILSILVQTETMSTWKHCGHVSICWVSPRWGLITVLYLFSIDLSPLWGWRLSEPGFAG